MCAKSAETLKRKINMIKATGDNVFIKREAKTNHGFDVEISEKALTSNLIGVITHTRSNKFVTIGDLIHLPHYGVEDLMVDGEEYAVAKLGELFTKKEGNSFLPINRYVEIRKCENDHVRNEKGDVALFMTDGLVENTNWVEIIDVADDCEQFTKEDIGTFCYAPEDNPLLARFQYTKTFFLHESLIEFVTDGEGMLKPKNNRVIVRRIEADSNGIIELPSGFKADTPLWSVVSFGDGIKTTTGQVVPVDLTIGSTVMLKEGSWTGISFEGVDYAVVSEDDISIELGE